MQFARTIIRVLDTFVGTFETGQGFKMIPIAVVACNKDYGLFGIDALKVNTTKIINSIKAVENHIRSFEINGWEFV